MKKWISHLCATEIHSSFWHLQHLGLLRNLKLKSELTFKADKCCCLTFNPFPFRDFRANIISSPCGIILSKVSQFEQPLVARSPMQGNTSSDWGPWAGRLFHSLPVVSESRLSAVILGKTASAASMPLFMAVWVPLIFGTFMKPGLQPISSPPGNVSFGMDCRGRWRAARLFVLLCCIQQIWPDQCIHSLLDVPFPIITCHRVKYEKV